MDARGQKKKIRCYYCNRLGHMKRECPKMSCYFCGGNHMKKHCWSYFLELRYRKWKKIDDKKKENYKNLLNQKEEFEKKLNETQQKLEESESLSKFRQLLYESLQRRCDFLENTSNQDLKQLQENLREAQAQKDDLYALKSKIREDPPTPTYRNEMIDWCRSSIRYVKDALDEIDDFIKDFNGTIRYCKQRKKVKRAEYNKDDAIKNRRAFEFLRKRLIDFLEMINDD